MKRYKKKEILETADLLIEGNNYITNNYSMGDSDSIIEILSQSQEMAILLGNCLESFGDSAKELVSVLEDYCEKIYQFSQSLSDEFTCRKIAKTTTRQLANLKINIIDQIPDDRIEMVFLPYKASMWDSLESVWRAAKEDPECDAYVVPIPYYERNNQGELAVMHYEGNQFPKDVPVVHYMDYNLAERRPDVAFIHNPYDQYNYVTSVHPAYYVPELKKYVEKVAYIPYFVSAEPNPDSIDAQEQKKGFVLKPGVMNSDLVFVQSEDMKRLYVNILEREVPNVSREYWENKIFGLGSPKLDRVHSTKRNDDLLLPAWHSLIYDSEEKRKKVIFYNTSLHDLLNQDNMMDKIADTLAFFKKRDDCTLWWRPHPLYESTLASMRPELLPIYREIVENYKKEGWGIFDEGEDLNWAIAETDAYYGDGSSVVQLYKEAGKPVLYQDTRVKNSVEEDVDIPIWPCAFCVDGNDIWFVHGKINVLMRYNTRTKESVVLGCIPEEIIFQETLYESIYKYGNFIYLIPCWARAISVYDIETYEFCRIELKNCSQYQNKLLFKNIYPQGKYLYCIPYFYPAIIKLDMSQKSIEYIDLRCLGDAKNENYINESTRIGNQIFSTWRNSEYLMILNLDKDKVYLKKYGMKAEKFIKLCQLNDSLYLYDDNNILWKKCESSSSLIQIVKVPYNRIQMYKMKDRLVLASGDNVSSLIVDLQDNILVEEREKTEFLNSSLAPSYIDMVFGCENDDNVEKNYYFDKYIWGWIAYGNPKEILEAKIKKEYLNIIFERFSLQEYMTENELFNLNRWINIINLEVNINTDRNCSGIKIKNEIKGVFVAIK